MTVLIIHGSPRKKGCSSNIARMFLKNLNPEKVLEIELQKDNLPHCKGCLNCLHKGIEYCPHSNITLEYKEKIIEADLIIVAAPVYILHMTAILKNLFDHFPTFCMIHRPEKTMFKKQIVIIGVSAGSTVNKTINEINGIFSFMGVSRVYKLGAKVMAENFNKISEKKMNEINNKVDKISNKIIRNKNKTHINIKVRGWLLIAKILQKKKFMCELDHKYWSKNGWLSKTKPWQ